MTALDDAYRAAEDAVLNAADGTIPLRVGIDAFLAHLADNPPDEMVQAMPWTTIKTLGQARRFYPVALRAALRAIRPGS